MQNPRVRVIHKVTLNFLQDFLARLRHIFKQNIEEISNLEHRYKPMIKVQITLSNFMYSTTQNAIGKCPLMYFEEQCIFQVFLQV